MSKKHWIELSAPHRHNGRDYKAGARLALRPDQAEWLVGLGKALPAQAPQAAPAAAGPHPVGAAQAANGAGQVKAAGPHPNPPPAGEGAKATQRAAKE